MGWEKSYYRCASVSPVEISEERREKSHNALGGVGVRTYNLKKDSNISAEGTSSKCKELMNKYEPLHPAITFYVFPIVEEETAGDILKSFPKRSPKQCKQRCWIWELGPRINSVEQMDVSLTTGLYVLFFLWRCVLLYVLWSVDQIHVCTVEKLLSSSVPIQGYISAAKMHSVPWDLLV